MIERAVAWKPANTPALPPSAVAVAPDCTGCTHWAEAMLEPGGAFDCWREDQGQSGATPAVFNQPLYRPALREPARNTKDLACCPTCLRDWQYTLEDYRYGWLVYTRAASGCHWNPHGDWRELEPNAFWPAAGGSQTAGGL